MMPLLGVDRKGYTMVDHQEKILIVDDEPAARKLITRILSKEGYQCEEVHSAVQAMDRLKSNKAELVILDIRMPGKSGIELLPEIKAIYPDTTVIMVSAIIKIPSAVQRIKLGAEGYIFRPFKTDELASIVEKTLYKRKLQIKSNKTKCSLEDAIPPVIKDKVLARLNSIKTPLELKNAINIYTGKPTCSILNAKRILDERAELGSFRELQDVTALRGIGPKRFNVIVNALSQAGEK